MEYIININPQNAQAVAFLEYAKTLTFLKIIQKKESKLTLKEKKFLKNLHRSATHAKEIASGERKGNPINLLLDEV